MAYKALSAFLEGNQSLPSGILVTAVLKGGCDLRAPFCLVAPRGERAESQDTGFVTSGYNLVDFVEELRKLRTPNILLSLDVARKERHDIIRSRPGALAPAGIGALIELAKSSPARMYDAAGRMKRFALGGERETVGGRGRSAISEASLEAVTKKVVLRLWRATCNAVLERVRRLSRPHWVREIKARTSRELANAIGANKLSLVQVVMSLGCAVWLIFITLWSIRGEAAVTNGFVPEDPSEVTLTVPFELVFVILIALAALNLLRRPMRLNRWITTLLRPSSLRA
jgi:hypothetical protein